MYPNVKKASTWASGKPEEKGFETSKEALKISFQMKKAPVSVPYLESSHWLESVL